MNYKIVIGFKGWAWIWSNHGPGENRWWGYRYWTWPRLFNFTFEVWHA